VVLTGGLVEPGSSLQVAQIRPKNADRQYFRAL